MHAPYRLGGRLVTTAEQREWDEEWGAKHAEPFGATFELVQRPGNQRTPACVWTCAAKHTWQTLARDNITKFPGLCRECVRDCRQCRRSLATRAFVDGGRLLKTCPECRAALVVRRDASAEAARAEKMRLQPLRPASRMDEMDDDLMLAIVLRAHAGRLSTTGRNVMLVARAACRKFERVTFEHARAALGLPAARPDVVWFASELRPIAYTDLQFEYRLGVPQCFSRAARAALGRPLTMADGIRESLRLYGTRDAIPRPAGPRRGVHGEWVLARLAKRVREIDEVGVLGEAS